MKRRSIGRRLIASVLIIQSISALAVVLATLGFERHTHFEAFDIMLRGRADSILGAVQDADDEADDIMLDRTGLQLPSGDIYEVQEGSGRVLGRSSNWAGVSGALEKQPSDGISGVKVDHVPYRIIRLHGLRVVDPGKQSGGVAHAVTVVYGSRTTGVWTEIRKAVAFYAAASCLLLILTGSLMSWLLHRGLLPLRQLASQAEGISAERWTFRAPDTARATRELAPLATALSSAVKRLEQSFQQQRHFVSDAAHELKTSVAVLKSSLQLLNMRQRSTEEYEAGLYRCLLDCGRMEDTVAKMLTLARFENPKEASTGPIFSELTSCAITASEQLRPLAQLGRVTLHVNVSATQWVRLPREEATLLCSNLLMNAIQHSEADGQVLISVGSLVANTVELRISDHGKGIDVDTLPHVFERFYRGDPSRTRKSGGTGLGLAICRAIAHRAGGTVHLESAPGSGTVAIVRLPRAERVPSAAATVPLTNLAASACVNEPVER